MNSDHKKPVEKLREVIADEKVREEIQRSLRGFDEGTMQSLLDQRITKFAEGNIYAGHIVRCNDNEVVVDIGYKGEGFINREEFDSLDDIQAGDAIEVLLEAFDEDSGEMILSKRKADRIRGWETVIKKYKLGDNVTGKVVRKIKGGLLVDVGVQVFLPASQVDVRRIPDIGEFVGREIDAKIIKIDYSRRNIVLSRRQMLEDRRDKMKEKLLTELAEGQLVTGEVKNITDFGAFVDLGGIDGLLHIVDMSWQRVNHPSEIVKIGDKIEVIILKIDQERERISVSLKHKTASPWENIEERYPVGSIHSGKVVNIMPYGAFVQLEEGIEGLVHVSEMSWTKQINHPSEIVSLGDKVDIVILGINNDKKEISLGMKQTERNPWETLIDRFPVGTVVEGTVKNIVNYGAFVEIEEGIEGLLHVSDMSWTKKIANPATVVKKNDNIKAVVTSIDTERKRISLSLKLMEDNPWDTSIPYRYTEGLVVSGKVTNITDKGVFVDIGEVEAFMPHSEVSHKRIPARDLLDSGDEIKVKILTVNIPERSIRLSLREVQEPDEETARFEAKRELRKNEEAAKASAETAEGDEPTAKPAKKTRARKAPKTEKPPVEPQATPETAEAPVAADAEAPAPQEQAIAEEPVETPVKTPAQEEQAAAEVPAEAPVEAPAQEEQAAVEVPAEAPAPAKKAPAKKAPAKKAPAKKASAKKVSAKKASAEVFAEAPVEAPVPEEQAAAAVPVEEPAPETPPAEETPAEDKPEA